MPRSHVSQQATATATTAAAGPPLAAPTVCHNANHVTEPTGQANPQHHTTEPTPRQAGIVRQRIPVARTAVVNGTKKNASRQRQETPNNNSSDRFSAGRPSSLHAWLSDRERSYAEASSKSQPSAIVAIAQDAPTPTATARHQIRAVMFDPPSGRRGRDSMTFVIDRYAAAHVMVRRCNDSGRGQDIGSKFFRICPECSPQPNPKGR